MRIFGIRLSLADELGATLHELQQKLDEAHADRNEVRKGLAEVCQFFADEVSLVKERLT